MLQESKIGKSGFVSKTADSSQRQGAIAAGAGLILMIVPAMFASLVQGSLLVPGDAAATVQNVLANEMQLRLALISLIIVIILDVLVAWGLYIFFEPVNRTVSLLAGWFRVVYTAVFAAAIMNLADLLRLVATAKAVIGTEQLQTQAWLMLNAFSNEWDFALAIFGTHLILVGYLVLKASYMPKWLGILVAIAGAGYLFDSVAGFLLPGFGVTISTVTFIGEVLLGVWLLVKALSVKAWEKLALQSA